MILQKANICLLDIIINKMMRICNQISIYYIAVCVKYILNFLDRKDY